MKRGSIDTLVTGKVLYDRYSMSKILDHMVDSSSGENPVIKNVCAKVSGELADEIDQVVNLLGVSKRVFLECAFIDAIQKAKEIIDEEDYIEFFPSARPA